MCELALKLVVAAVFAVSTVAVGAEAVRYKDARAAYDRGLYKKALRLTRPLAERGDARAQHLLSLMYGLGRGVEYDECESARWTDRAARQGYVPAYYFMASAHFSGKGIPINNAMAYRWALAASRAGQKAAREDLNMFGAGLSERQRQRIRAGIGDWRPKDEPPLKIVRPPADWLGRFWWRLRGRRFCRD